jgi:hypothetical protein
MGGGAFILLKVGHPWPETAKQAEIRLANLLKILRERRIWRRKRFARRKRTCDGCISRFPRDMANLA